MIDPKHPIISKAASAELVSAYLHYMWCDWVRTFEPAETNTYRKVAATRYKDLPPNLKNIRREWAEHLLRLIKAS